MSLQTKKSLKSGKYFIGGLGKSLTALGILELAQKMQLKFSDTVATHIPQAGKKLGELSLSDLLVQNNALPNLLEDSLWSQQSANLASILKVLETDDLDYKTPHYYSDSGYIVLEEIIRSKVGGDLSAFYKGLLSKYGLPIETVEENDRRIPGAHRSRGFDEKYWAGKASFSKLQADAQGVSDLLDSIRELRSHKNEFSKEISTLRSNNRGAFARVDKGVNGETFFYEDEGLGDYLRVWENEKLSLRLIILNKNSADSAKTDKLAGEVYTQFLTYVLSQEK